MNLGDFLKYSDKYNRFIIYTKNQEIYFSGNKEKLIKFLIKEFINFKNDVINRPIIIIDLLLNKIENGEFDNE